MLVRAKPEIVQKPFFRLYQLLRCTVFDGEYIPACFVRHSIFRGFDEDRVGMRATTVTPTVCPSGFIVPAEKSVARRQGGFPISRAFANAHERATLCLRSVR